MKLQDFIDEYVMSDSEWRDAYEATRRARLRPESGSSTGAEDEARAGRVARNRPKNRPGTEGGEQQATPQ